MPPTSATAKLVAPNRQVATATTTAMTAPMPLLRFIWLRINRQRSQRMVLSWSQFISSFQPAKFLRLLAFVADDGQELVLQRPGAPQLLHRALMNQFPVRDDAHVRAESLDNLEHVRSQEDRRAAPDALFEGVAQHAGGDGIHTLERFVQEQQVGVGNQGGGQG